jgi:hypothetical protein
MSMISKGSAVFGVMALGAGYFNYFGKETAAVGTFAGVALISGGAALELVEGLYSKKK